ncbi:MAG: flippase-like domain-containing protein [Chloroflexi bacterium]|nr:flippase-like domain-containing protein [Chloroflexota bacterium]MDA1269699.1 flippase-like domain-containing protein [Chloroflexota bacterium]PKB58071.1 MAG: hypothetical protein BZY83_08910 [SAR202 cluster bacterium Casp-Chloro-G2]
MPQAFRRLSGPAAVAAAAILGLIIYLVTALDWHEAGRVLADADWRWIAGALLLTALSYAAEACGYALVNRWFGIRLPIRDLIEIGMVSSTMIASVGGLAGHSVRILLLTRRNVRRSQGVAPSLFHGYFQSLAFFLFIPGGLTYLLLTHPLDTHIAVIVGIGTAVLGVAFAITAVVFLYRPVRSRVLAWFVIGARRIARIDISPSITLYEETLDRGLAALGNRPVALGVTVAWILVDRVAQLAVLWFCLEALGVQDVGVGVVVTGFAIGIALGVMSMVPGGIGIQEGTMAGTYHLLGMPLEEAVVVALLFRIIFQLVPLGLSVSLYWRVLREAPKVKAQAG